MDLNPVREQKHRLKKMKPDAWLIFVL
jgi:hypothetical protein